jgi:hypothetical protein
MNMSIATAFSGQRYDFLRKRRSPSATLRTPAAGIASSCFAGFHRAAYGAQLAGMAWAVKLAVVGVNKARSSLTANIN